jgi:hypothetical protein
MGAQAGLLKQACIKLGRQLKQHEQWNTAAQREWSYVDKGKDEWQSQLAAGHCPAEHLNAGILREHLSTKQHAVLDAFAWSRFVP